VEGVLDVAGGRIRGHEEDGVWLFAGIPYARAPIGALRWRPPAPPEPWSGVRSATAFGPMAPQMPSVAGAGVPGDPTEQSEDCLSINVWTPSPNDGRRPVMIWIHGGGFTSGTGSSLLYRGDDLCRNGDVVVVTCNYRLGALGYLAHPALAVATTEGETFGNWGLLDQLCALRWVHEHVGAFGGDPDNVTVFGESAGAMSIAALLAAPSARGLFRRAILQSGPPYTHSSARATSAAEDLVAALGLPDLDRRRLEAVPAVDLVEATRGLQAQLPRPGEVPIPFLPVVDGSVLPRRPEDALADGEAAGVDVLVGTNRDELTFFILGDQRFRDVNDEDGLLRWLARAVPEVPGEGVVAVYEASLRARGEATTPRDILVAAGTDLVFRWPSLSLAASQTLHGASAYVYLFTWETPVFGGLLGACHALELPFVFGSVRRPAVAAFTGDGPAAEALSDQMQQAWLSFARHGNPSHEALGNWPAWDPTDRATMVFGRDSAVVDGPRNEELTVWERAAPLAGAASYTR
jgi:para-nitrobenzyl esterase